MRTVITIIAFSVLCVLFVIQAGMIGRLATDLSRANEQLEVIISKWEKGFELKCEVTE